MSIPGENKANCKLALLEEEATAAAASEVNSLLQTEEFHVAYLTCI